MAMEDETAEERFDRRMRRLVLAYSGFLDRNCGDRYRPPAELQGFRGFQ